MASLFASGLYGAEKAKPRAQISLDDVISPAVANGPSGFFIVAHEPPSTSLMFMSVAAGSGKVSKPISIGDRVSAAGITWASDGLHVFVCGPDGFLLHRLMSPAGAWGEWQRLQGPFKGRPAAATYQGKVHVFALGNGNRVFALTGLGTTFSAPHAVPDMVSVCSPSAVASAEHLHVIGLDSANHFVLRATLTNERWSAPRTLYTDPINSPAGPPTVALSTDAKSIYLAFRSHLANNLIVGDTWYDANSFEGDKVACSFKGYPVVHQFSNGHQVMFVRGTDNALYYSELGSYWGDWKKIVPGK